MDQKRIKTNMLWNAFGSLVFLGCQWLTTVLVVRLSSSFNTAGQLSIAMAIANIFVPIGLFKVRSYQVSDITNAVSPGSYVAFRLISIFAGLLLIAIYSFLTCALSDAIITLAYCVYRSIEVFIDVLHGIDQKNNRMDFCGISMLLRGIFGILAFTCGLIISQNLLFAIILMSLSNAPIIVYDIKVSSRFCSLRPDFDLHSLKVLFSDCFPAALAFACCSATTSIAKQYLGVHLGQSILGIYSSVCTPAVIIQAGASFVYAPLLGLFSEYEYKKAADKFTKLLFKSLAVISLIGLVACVLAFVFGSYFLEIIFGNSIIPYTYLLFAALISAAATSLIGFVSDLSIVRRQMKVNLLGNFVSLVLIFPLSVIFVDHFGANGISFAISISYLIGSSFIIRALLKF